MLNCYLHTFELLLAYLPSTCEGGDWSADQWVIKWRESPGFARPGCFAFPEFLGYPVSVSNKNFTLKRKPWFGRKYLNRDLHIVRSRQAKLWTLVRIFSSQSHNSELDFGAFEFQFPNRVSDCIGTGKFGPQHIFGRKLKDDGRTVTTLDAYCRITNFVPLCHHQRFW